VVLCGHDDDYPAAFAAFAASAVGASFVALAGRPGDHEAAYRAAGLTHAVIAGKDVLALLHELAAASGVP
jgi:methylmalonyl-CoA mutase